MRSFSIVLLSTCLSLPSEAAYSAVINADAGISITVTDVIATDADPSDLEILGLSRVDASYNSPGPWFEISSGAGLNNLRNCNSGGFGGRLALHVGDEMCIASSLGLDRRGIEPENPYGGTFAFLWLDILFELRSSASTGTFEVFFEQRYDLRVESLGVAFNEDVSASALISGATATTDTYEFLQVGDVASVLEISGVEQFSIMIQPGEVRFFQIDADTYVSGERTFPEPVEPSPVPLPAPVALLTAAVIGLLRLKGST